MRIFKFVFLILLISTSTHAAEDEITIGTKHKIYSETLQEEREYWLYLPPNYNEHVKYPVIYALDGARSFEFASAILKQKANMAKIPEMIMVSVLNTDRNRDMTPTHVTSDEYNDNTGGANKFLKFLEYELIPHIETNYSTAKSRSLSGHSLTGLFALYAHLEKPDLFINILAIDPTIDWDNHFLIKKLKEQNITQKETTNTVYITSIDKEQFIGLPIYEEFKILHELITDFSAIDKALKGDNLRIKNTIIPNETHGSVELLSFYQGIDFFFEGYMIDIPKMTEDPSYVLKHYENVSKKFGYNILPNEEAVNYVAYKLLNIGEIEDALKYFKLNTKNYPNSANTFDSLSDAYKEMGNKDMVIKSLEKALVIDPNFVSSHQKLKAIKSEN